MNSYAAGPKSPMPPREGSEVGWRRMPAERGKDMQPSTDAGQAVPPPTTSFAKSASDLMRYGVSRSTHATQNELLAFAGSTRQAFQFFLVDFDLARLLKLLAEVTDEHAE
jgi:hypothetical protein